MPMLEEGLEAVVDGVAAVKHTKTMRPYGFHAGAC